MYKYIKKSHFPGCWSYNLTVAIFQFPDEASIHFLISKKNKKLIYNSKKKLFAFGTNSVSILRFM